MSVDVPSGTGASGPKSTVIQHLREHGPSTREELPGEPTAGRNREVIARLFMPGPTSSGAAKTRPQGHHQHVVYYLYGDERRAVRKFIELYPEYVASCMGDPQSPLHQHSLWTMFVEEWQWGEWE